MLTHQFQRVLAACFQCGQNTGRGWRIAQRHRDIAQPARVSRAPQGTAFGAFAPFRFGPAEQIHQSGLIQSVPDGKIRLSARAGKLVPGADQLAIVTAENTVAHRGSQFGRDRARCLYGEVADAAARIQRIGCGDRLCRTDVQAGLAAATVIARRCVDCERQIGVDLAEQEA